jgi:hypothetical protein
LGMTEKTPLFYAMCAPALPVLRARHLRGKLQSAGLVRLVFPSIAMGLMLDGIGQAIGFLLGAGDTTRKLPDFEVDRLRHVTPADRRLLEQQYSWQVCRIKLMQ